MDPNSLAIVTSLGTLVVLLLVFNGWNLRRQERQMIESMHANTDEIDGDLQSVFVPALVTILATEEKHKGRPLTEDEVLQIRDNATTIMVPSDSSDSITRSRECDDIDPENCWAEWLAIRE